MPQMAPINWLSLMIMFSFILVTFNIVNYYSFSYNIKSSSKTQQIKKINWKW